MSHALSDNTTTIGTAPCVGGRNVDLSAYGVQQVDVKYTSNATIPLASRGNWTIRPTALMSNGSLVCNGIGTEVVDADSFDWAFYARGYSDQNQTVPWFGLPGHFLMFSAVQKCSADPNAECPYFVSDNYTILDRDGSSVEFTESTSGARPATNLASWATIGLTAMASVAGLGIASP